MPRFLIRTLSHRRWPLVLAVLVVVGTTPALWAGFIADDFVHRALWLQLPEFSGFAANRLDMFAFVPGDPLRNAEQRRLALPWWSAPDLKLSFWRPLAALTHALDYAAWPNTAWAMHLHSILWYVLAVTIVARVFRTLFDERWKAGLAAFVYAMSHTHAGPVFFLANRNALVGISFGSLALLLHHRARQERRLGLAILATVALLLGLLANEGTIAACGYLFAYAMFVETDRTPRRFVTLVPYLVVVVVWRLAYQWLGYGAWASEAYVDPGRSPLAFFDAVILRAPVYLLAQWLLLPSDASQFVPAAALIAWRLLAVAFLALLFALFFPLLRRDRVARFWFVGMVLSVIPSCATFPSDRMLLYPGIGGAALLVRWLAVVDAQTLFPTTARIRKVTARILATVLIALHLVLSPLWLPLVIHTGARWLLGMTDGVERVANMDGLSGKLVVIVDDVLLSGVYFSALRALARRDPVDQLLVLAPLMDRFDPIVFSRPSDNTLVMEISGGYPWLLERDRAHPFKPGDSVVTGRVTAEIERTDDEGRPTRVAFRFDTPLEHESIAWFGRLESAGASAFPLRGRYPAWQPPAVGGTIVAR
jgi:hypothetical protein